MKVGTLVQDKSAEIYSLFAPVEGFNHVYFGKVRNGKTYAATADILELLQRGEIVYANWKIDFADFDERNSFWIVFVKFMAGKQYFYKFDSRNFHYFNTDEPDLIQNLNKLVGVHIFVDEGQWIFNSHLKTDDPDKRRLILEGGHYCRSLNVITQRPMNIMKDIRSQVNIWYKCEKRRAIFGMVFFTRYEIEEMKDDVPVEPYDNDGRINVPVKTYRASKRVFEAYETHGMRRPDAIYIEPYFDVYVTTYFERLFMLYAFFVPKFVKRSARKISVRAVASWGIYYPKIRQLLGLDKNNIIPHTLKAHKSAFKIKDIKNLK